MEEQTINDKATRRREMQKLYYIKNKEAILTKKKEFYQTNKEQIIKSVLLRRELKPEQHAEQFKKRYHANKEEFLKKAKLSYIKNRDHIIAKRSENKNKALTEELKKE